MKGRVGDRVVRWHYTKDRLKTNNGAFFGAVCSKLLGQLDQNETLNVANDCTAARVNGSL